MRRSLPTGLPFLRAPDISDEEVGRVMSAWMPRWQCMWPPPRAFRNSSAPCPVESAARPASTACPTMLGRRMWLQYRRLSCCCTTISPLEAPFPKCGDPSDDGVHAVRQSSALRPFCLKALTSKSSPGPLSTACGPPCSGACRRRTPAPRPSRPRPPAPRSSPPCARPCLWHLAAIARHIVFRGVLRGWGFALLLLWVASGPSSTNVGRIGTALGQGSAQISPSPTETGRFRQHYNRPTLGIWSNS